VSVEISALQFIGQYLLGFFPKRSLLFCEGQQFVIGF
jgi:hypothetical protein